MKRDSRLSVPLDDWTLTVEGPDVAGGRVVLELADLPDWRDVVPLRYSSSPGVYTTEAELPVLESGQTAELAVGWVHGAAEVKVNGSEAGVLLAPPFALDVSRWIQPGPNSIEITVIPALRNRFQGYANAGDGRYRQYGGKDNMLLPGGIRGPVSMELR